MRAELAEQPLVPQFRFVITPAAAPLQRGARLRHNEHVARGTGTKPMIIVGGGEAGGTAAATLREDGFGGPVVIISGEPGIPFGRPPLSKTYLRSEEDLTGWYVKPADWYEAHDVDLIESSVTAVDAAAHTLLLDSGRELEYQKVLIATGGRKASRSPSGVTQESVCHLWNCGYTGLQQRTYRYCVLRGIEI